MREAARRALCSPGREVGATLAGRFIHRRGLLLGGGGLVLAGRARAAQRLPQVVIATSRGAIVVEVEDRKAPITAANFLGWVDRGVYAGGSFYRAVTKGNDRGKPPIEVIQGGRGMAWEDKVPGVAHEPTSLTGLRHRDGTISMSRDKPGTATTEFFICIGDQPALDAGGGRGADGLGFAAFGRVVEGMDVVRAIQRLPTPGKAPDAYVEGQMLEPAVRIEAIRRLAVC
jgi:peptidyl-prolyl cis-trans isomerase A (cyclophilin A)